LGHHFDIAVVFQESGDIADSLLRITGERRELRELARYAAFNILGGNRDDDAKIFSLLMDSSGQWSQSPAYDITASPGPGRQGIHVASVNGSATPTQQDFLSFGKRAELDDAEEIFEKARDSVRNWPSFAKQAGLRDAKIKRISKSHRCL